MLGTHVTEKLISQLVLWFPTTVLLHYLRKCSSPEIASFHVNAVSLLCQF